MKHRLRSISIALLCALPVQAAESIDDDPAAWEFTDGSITFLCVDPEGTPLPDVTVDFVEWEEYTPPLTAEVIQVRTNTEGKCTFTNLSGVKLQAVHATWNGWGCWSVNHFIRPSDKHPTATLKLDVYRDVCGVVVDKNGHPIRGVTILNHGVLPGAMTDERGAFCLANLHGQQDFSFYKAGYGWLNSALAKSIAVFQLTLPDGGILDVTVLDEMGRPVPRARVTYSSGQQFYGVGASATQFTDEQGKITTVWLPSDRDTAVEVSYERDGYYWAARSEIRPPTNNIGAVTLRPTAQSKIVIGGERRSVSLRERPKGVVTGKVIMEGTGKPVWASILFDTSSEWVRSIRTTTKDDGTFRCEGLELGTYYFTAFPGEAALYTKGGPVRVDLTAEKPAQEVTLTIVEGCAIHGDVKSAEGLPVPRAQVVYSPRNPNHDYPVITDEMGHFSIPHLAFPDKPYQLSIHHGQARPVKVETGPIGRGKISEPLAITLADVYLAPTSVDELQGQVIDQNGAPVRGASVSLSLRTTSDVTETDRAGRFTLNLREHGEGTLSVEYATEILVNGARDAIRKPLSILEGETVSIASGTAPPLHTVRVNVPPWKYVGGFVTDTEGNPLSPDVFVYADDCWASGYATNGGFVRTGCMKPLEKDPVLLEFRLGGYQARVLESGRDFELGDTRVRVVMKKGPYEPFESIFHAVTGRPASEAREMFRGDLILKNTVEYWRIARGTSGSIELPPNWVIVKDENGAPVTRILLRSPYGNHPIILSTGEESGFPPETLEDKQGRYTLPNEGRFVWADGNGMEFVQYPSLKPGVEPRILVLHPAASITVRAIETQGHPVSGVTIGLTSTNKDWPRFRGSSPPHPRTDESGALQFPHLAPGEYEFWAHGSGFNSVRATVTLSAGETKTIDLRPATEAL